MAVIPQAELDDMRQEASRHIVPVTYVKAQANAVFQAIEDWEMGGHTVAPTESREDAIEAAVGVAVPLRMEKVFWMIWSEWKQKQLRGDI